MYHDNNPMEIVKVFEDLLQKKLIGYKQPNVYKDGFLISFRMFVPSQAQFILRYLFAFKMQEILNSVVKGSQDEQIRLMVGKGKAKLDKQSVLAPFIMKELRSWNPPINSSVDTRNSGLLVIDKKELIPYCNNEMNFAKQILINPSSDWYIA